MAKKPGLYTTFNETARVQETPVDGHHIGRRETQLLFGEAFIVDSIQDGWAKGRTFFENYPGYVRMNDLRKGRAPDHVVSAFMTHAYPEPNMKTAPRLTLSFMSEASVIKDSEENGFIRLHDRRTLWVPKDHLKKINDTHRDPIDVVGTAMMFLDSPYGYGGRVAWGIDCSGLTQIVQKRFGLSCPRDSDQQENFIGQNVPLCEMTRGDFVFFPGHVGIMVDEKNMINATQRYMRVVIENIDEITPIYGPPTSVRRLQI